MIRPRLSTTEVACQQIVVAQLSEKSYRSQSVNSKKDLSTIEVYAVDRGCVLSTTRDIFCFCLLHHDVSAALVKHEVRRKDNESSYISITTEALTAREIGSNHRKGNEMLVSSRLVIANWERANVLFARKKNIERLIVQGSRRRRDKNQNQISHRLMMVLILILQYYLSITPIVCYSEESE